MDKKYVATTLVTIALAILGYFAKYVNDIRIMNRKEKLEMAGV